MYVAIVASIDFVFVGVGIVIICVDKHLGGLHVFCFLLYYDFVYVFVIVVTIVIYVLFTE